MTSRFQPSRLLTPVLLVLALIAVSYWLNPEPWLHMTLLTKATFAGALLVFAGLMVTMRSRYFLRMDERGLEIQYIVGAPRFYAWKDIEAARVFKKRLLMIPVMSTIRIRLRPGARSGNSVRRAAGNLIGADVTFLAVYDESAQEILAKIQMFQRNHGAQ